jgi:HSP20 family protein
MNALIKGNHGLKRILGDSDDTFFGRTIEDLLAHDFFNSPGANIREEKDSYRLEIAVPGMTRKDITIHIDDSVLQVSARKRENRNSWNTMEFNTTHYQRSFALPAAADASDIKAKCRNGILTIHIGKIRPKGAPRVIKVQGGETDAAIPGVMALWWNRLKETIRHRLAGKR